MAGYRIVYIYHKHNFRFFSFLIKHTYVKSKSKNKILRINCGYLMDNGLVSDFYFLYSLNFLSFPGSINYYNN